MTNETFEANKIEPLDSAIDRPGTGLDPIDQSATDPIRVEFRPTTAAVTPPE